MLTGAVPTAHCALLRTIADWTRANRRQPDEGIERELVRLRHEAFVHRDQTLDAGSEAGASPSVAVQVPIDGGIGLPYVEGVPSAAVVRSAIDSHGSLIVRRLISAEAVAMLRDAIVSALAAREAPTSFAEASAWYHEFETLDPGARAFTVVDGALAADSPRALFRLLEVFHEHGIDQLAGDFLGAIPAISAEKTVLRRVHPQPPAAWHQDGAFLGERIRTLDVWIALTPCGRKTPGLEVLPRRVDHVLPTGGIFSWGLPNEVVQASYPGVDSVKPEFEPGDAMLFDQLCVHRTGWRPDMEGHRLGIECWFFAADSVPADYTGLIV